MLRRVARAELGALRLQLKAARKTRRAARARARVICRDAKAAVRAWVKRERELLRTETAKRRANTCTICAAAKGLAGKAALAEYHAKHAVDRQAAIVRGLAGPAKKQAIKGAVLAAERRAHLEHEATVDLTPDELVVFKAVRNKLRPNERMSLREAFDHWVHEHNGDVHTILRKHYDKEVARLASAEVEQRRALGQDLAGLTDAKVHELVRATAEPLVVGSDIVRMPTMRPPSTPSVRPPAAQSVRPPLRSVPPPPPKKRATKAVKKPVRERPVSPGSKLGKVWLSRTTEPIVFESTELGRLEWDGNGTGYYRRGGLSGELSTSGHELRLGDWGDRAAVWALGDAQTLTADEAMNAAVRATVLGRSARFDHKVPPLTLLSKLKKDVSWTSTARNRLEKLAWNVKYREGSWDPGEGDEEFKLSTEWVGDREGVLLNAYTKHRKSGPVREWGLGFVDDMTAADLLERIHYCWRNRSDWPTARRKGARSLPPVPF